MKFLSCILLASALLATSAHASTVDFSDTSIVWPGLTHTFVDKKGKTVTVGAELPSPNPDQNGVPDLLGGTFTFSTHILTKITLRYQDLMPSSWNSIWNQQTPGDWYFNVNQGSSNVQAWDYVIHWDGNLNQTNAPDSYHLYKAIDYWGYGDNMQYVANYNKKAGQFVQYNGYYGNTNDRDWHPTTIKDPSGRAFVDLGVVSYSGWTEADDLLNGIGSSTWDLSKVIGGGLDMGRDVHQFTYGFTMSCANDVLFGDSPIPNPEPATMLLAGLGAAGAGIARWRTQRKAA